MNRQQEMLVMGSVNPQYWQKIKNLFGVSIVDYYLAQNSGTAAIDSVGGKNGTHSGVDIAQASIGGSPACFYDGNDYTSIVAAKDVFPTAAGAIVFWVQSAVWADANNRTTFVILTDSQNYIDMTKLGATCYFRIRGTNVAKQVSKNIVAATPFPIFFEWSKAADTFEVWDGNPTTKAVTQIGTTQAGFGAWVGAPTRMIIGANGTDASQPSIAYLSDFIILNRVLTAGERTAFMGL